MGFQGGLGIALNNISQGGFMAQSTDPKQNMAGEKSDSTGSQQTQESSSPKSAGKKNKNETFGNKPKVDDPELPQQPDKYEVGETESTPRREDMH